MFGSNKYLFEFDKIFFLLNKYLIDQVGRERQPWSPKSCYLPVVPESRFVTCIHAHAAAAAETTTTTAAALTAWQ